MHTTTIGQLLLDEALPPDLRGPRTLDKKGLQDLFQEVATRYPEQYRDILQKLNHVGREAAYRTGGFSFGLEHLGTAHAAKLLQARVQPQIRQILDEEKDPQQRQEKIIALLRSEQKPLEKAIYDESLLGKNPLALQILSGSRGNPAGLKSLRGADLLYADHQGRDIPFPVLRNYSQGLMPAEYFAGAYGARSGVISTKMAVRDAGALAKQLIQASHQLIVTGQDHEDDGELRGLPVDTDDADNEGAVLAQAAGGYKRNTILTPKVLRDLKAKGADRILIRSPVSGRAGPNGGLYAMDVGVRERGGIAPLYDNVGVAAAQSTAEPISQGQLCLAEGTLVRMADGSIKAIEDIQPGDEVVGCNLRCQTRSVKVLRCFNNGPKHCWTYRAGADDHCARVTCTEDHKFLAYNQNGNEITPTKWIDWVCWLFADPTKVTFNAWANGYTVPFNAEIDAGIVPTYDIEVDHPDHLFVLANGLVVSNSSKHGGGVSGAGVSASGFQAIEKLIQVPKSFPGGATHAEADGTITDIREAPQGGQYVFVDGQEHYVAPGFDIRVQKGDKVEAGDVLSSGLPNPAKVVEHKGVGEGRRYFVQTLRQVLKDSGMTAHRRNLELLSRGLVNHVEMEAETDNHLPGDVVPYQLLEASWQPREGSGPVAPKLALGKYLERPVLHYSIGTKIRPSMLPELERFGVKEVTVHQDPPPFKPLMVRGMDNLSHDPDWMAQTVGSNLKRNLLGAAQSGAVSDLNSLSYGPGLAEAVSLGKTGPVRSRGPVTLKAADTRPAATPAGGTGQTPNLGGVAPKLQSEGPDLQAPLHTVSGPYRGGQAETVTGPYRPGTESHQVQTQNGPPPAHTVSGPYRGAPATAVGGPYRPGTASQQILAQGQPRPAGMQLTMAPAEGGFDPQAFLQPLGQMLFPQAAKGLGQAGGLPALFAAWDMLHSGGRHLSGFWNDTPLDETAPAAGSPAPPAAPQAPAAPAPTEPTVSTAPTTPWPPAPTVSTTPTEPTVSTAPATPPASSAAPPPAADPYTQQEEWVRAEAMRRFQRTPSTVTPQEMAEVRKDLADPEKAQRIRQHIAQQLSKKPEELTPQDLERYGRGMANTAPLVMLPAAGAGYVAGAQLAGGKTPAATPPAVGTAPGTKSPAGKPSPLRSAVGGTAGASALSAAANAFLQKHYTGEIDPAGVMQAAGAPAADFGIQQVVRNIPTRFGRKQLGGATSHAFISAAKAIADRLGFLPKQLGGQGIGSTYNWKIPEEQMRTKMDLADKAWEQGGWQGHLAHGIHKLDLIQDAASRPDQFLENVLAGGTNFEQNVRTLGGLLGNNSGLWRKHHQEGESLAVRQQADVQQKMQDEQTAAARARQMMITDPATGKERPMTPLEIRREMENVAWRTANRLGSEAGAKAGPFGLLTNDNFGKQMVDYANAEHDLRKYRNMLQTGTDEHNRPLGPDKLKTIQEAYNANLAHVQQLRQKHLGTTDVREERLDYQMTEQLRQLQQQEAAAAQVRQQQMQQQQQGQEAARLKQLQWRYENLGGDSWRTARLKPTDPRQHHEMQRELNYLYGEIQRLQAAQQPPPAAPAQPVVYEPAGQRWPN